MRKVTPTEIERLYRFTREHYVEYYDLQTELVDHLATGIEQSWAKQPHLSFEEGLHKEFKKFGVYGFSDIIEKHQRTMGKRYARLIWEEAKAQLGRPKLAFLFILLIVSTTYLLQREVTFYVFMGLFLSIGIYSMIKAYQFQKKKKTHNKVYLLEAALLQSGNYGLAAVLPIFIFNMLNTVQLQFTENFSLGINFLVSFILWRSILVYWITTSILPHKKEEILNRFYPEREII